MAVQFRNLQGGNPYQGIADTMERVSSRVGASWMAYGDAVRKRNEDRDRLKAEKEKSMVDAIVKLVPAAVGYEQQKEAIAYGKEQDKLDRQYKQSVLDESIASRQQTGKYQTAMLGEQKASREQRGRYQESVLEEQKASREQAGQYQASMLEKQTKMLKNSNKIKEITSLTRLENAQINKLKQQNLTDKIPFDQYETAAKLAEDVSTARLTRRTKLYELYTDIYGEADDLTNPNRDPDTGAAHMPFDMWVTTASNLGGYGMSEEEFNKLSEPFTYLDVYRQAGVKLTDENSAPKEEAETTVLAELTSENNARLSGGSGGGPPFDRYGGLNKDNVLKEGQSVDLKELTENTNINRSFVGEIFEPKKFHEESSATEKLSAQEQNELILERLATLSDEKLSKVLTEVDDQVLRGLIRVEMDRRKKGDSIETSAEESGGGFGTAQAGIQKQKDELPVYETVDIQKGSTLGDMYKLAKKNGFDPSVYYNEAQKKKGATPLEDIKIFKNAWSDHRESQGLIRLGGGDGEIPPRGEDLVLPKFWSDPVVDEVPVDPVVDEVPVMRGLPEKSALKDGTMEMGEETDQGEPNMEVAKEAIDNASVLASGTEPKTEPKTESLIKPLSEDEISQLDEYIYSPNTSRFTLKASGMEDFAKRNGYRVDYGPDGKGSLLMKFTKAEGEDRGEVIYLTRKRREKLSDFYERVEKELLIPSGFK